MTGDSTAERQLVLISGPIASGKTTVAFQLTTQARRGGRRAAAVDIDELVAMVAGDDWSCVRLKDRKLASEIASAIADRLFESGVTVVAIAGSTLASYEWTYLLSSLTCTPDTLIVLLSVSLAESIRRAQADPTRVSTRDPEVVTRLHVQIDWQDVTPHDLEIDTDGRSVDEVVAIIAANVFAGAS